MCSHLLLCSLVSMAPQHESTFVFPPTSGPSKGVDPSSSQETAVSMSVHHGNMHCFSAADGEVVLSDVTVAPGKSTGRRRTKKQ